jgi:hypothetical protein
MRLIQTILYLKVVKKMTVMMMEPKRPRRITFTSRIALPSRLVETEGEGLGAEAALAGLPSMCRRLSV